MLKKIIAKNIKFSAINKVASMLYSLIFFPFIVHYTGKEVYGLYILVLTISGYLSLLDMGVGSAVVKYVAEYKGRQDEERINSIINFSLTFFISIAVIIALGLFLLSFYFGSFFKIADANREMARRLFWVASLTALVYWPAFLFKNVLMGLQRYEWSSLGDIIIVIANAIAAYILFPRGGTIVDFQLISLFVVIGVLILYLVRTRALLKNLRIVFPYFNEDVYKLVFKYGVFLFLSGLVGMLIFQVGSLVIGLFISVSAVTLYGVAFSMQQNLRSVNAIIGSPFMPASAELHGREDPKTQKELFLKGTRFSTALFFPVIIISLIFAGRFITTWMGETFFESVLPAQILLVFWFFNGTMDIGANILYGRGIVRIFLWISVICAIFTVSLTLILVKFFGITGAALGITLPMIFINFPLVLYFVLKNLGVSFKEFYNNSIKSNLLFYLLVIAAAFVVNMIFGPRRIFLVLIEMLALYLTCVAVYYFVILRKEERAAVYRVLVS